MLLNPAKGYFAQTFDESVIEAFTLRPGLQNREV
jgi:hypothetical protein